MATQTPQTTPQPPVQASTLKVKTHVKAGLVPLNHSQTLVQAPRPAPGLKVKTHVKAGEVPLPGMPMNHNQTLARPTGLTVKTHLKAGLRLQMAMDR
jgi:hypothetical protein